MTILTRESKGSTLTHAELDGNITDLDGRVTGLEAHFSVGPERIELAYTFDNVDRSWLAAGISGTEAYLFSGQDNAGDYLPLSFFTGGTTALTIGTDHSVTFAGSRLVADFSNATKADRCMFASSSGETSVGAVPGPLNGNSSFAAYGGLPGSSSYLEVGVDTNDTYIESGKDSTADYKPLKVSVGGAERMAFKTDGSVSIGGAATPATPNTTHVMLPSSGLVGSAAAGLNIGENITYSNAAWRWVTVAAAGLYQINGGAHKFWTHTATGASAGGSMSALTERFRVDQGYTYNFQQFIQSSVAQITGTSTPPNGGGLELHWVAPDEAYVQALDRSGTTWKRLRLQGSDVQLNPSNTNKGGADSNGLYGVAMQKAGDPSTTEIPSGYWRVSKNTSTGDVKLWYNDGGTLKSVALA